jgi:hypothetical protein
VCVPTQPEVIGTEVIGTEARDSGVLGGGKKYDCPGYCSSDADNRVGGRRSTGSGPASGEIQNALP